MCDDNQLKNPQGLSFTSNGNIVVGDKGNKLIKDIFLQWAVDTKNWRTRSVFFPHQYIQTREGFAVSDRAEHCIKVELFV